MKQLLSISLLLLSTSAFAQKWSVGLNAGALWNTKPLNTDSRSSLSEKKSSVIAKAMNIGVNYKITPKWQVGLSLDYQDLNSRVKGTGDFPGPNGDYSYSYVDYFTNLSLRAKVNRVFTNHKFQYYGGVNFGITPTSLDYPNVDHLLSGGIQGGCYYHLTRHWSINAELTGNYFHGVNNGYANAPSVISTTGTVGIHYSF